MARAKSEQVSANTPQPAKQAPAASKSSATAKTPAGGAAKTGAAAKAGGAAGGATASAAPAAAATPAAPAKYGIAVGSFLFDDKAAAEKDRLATATSLAATVVPKDDGGTTNGGIDSSSPQIFTISITKPHVWHNTLHRFDVDGNGKVVPKDALDVINRLNGFGPGNVPANAPFGPLYFDTDANNIINPADALNVITFLNGFGPGLPGPDGEAEGEANAAPDQTAGQPSTNTDELIALLAADVIDLSSQRRRL